jgi:hypothetical protein
LRKTGDAEDFKLSAKFFPKLRIFVPIIVRGEEDQGVKFWAFGKQVYQDLLRIIADDEYGNITDIKEGHDITVEYVPKEQTTKSFPETHITARPKKTPVGDAKVIEAIKNQVNITDIYEEPTYATLQTALESFLKPENEDENADTDITEETPSPDSSAVASKAPKVESSKNVANDFDKLFS